MSDRKSKLGLSIIVFSYIAAMNVFAADRPNIVVIMSDNQAANLLGPYGNTEIRTPHIDRLAAEGMTFDNAYAINGVCSPTRATLMTGLIPSQTGVHRALPGQLDIEGWNAIKEYRNLPMTLKNAGYVTGQVGKHHLGNHTSPQLGYDYWVTFTSGHTTKFYDVEIIDNDKRYKTPTHLTDFWTTKAIDFIQQQSSEEPFFLFLSYNGPYILPPSVNRENKTRHADYYNDNTPKMPQYPVHPYLMT